MTKILQTEQEAFADSTDTIIPETTKNLDQVSLRSELENAF